MKIEFEMIQPDEGSSFRILHNKTNAEDYPWRYHYHPEYEIVCVLYGKGTRHVGNHFTNYEQGDLVLIGPNLPHAGFGLDAHGPHEEIVIQFKEAVLKPSLLTRPELSALNELLEKSKTGICFTGHTKAKITQKLTRLLALTPFEKFIEILSVLQVLATSTEYELLNPQAISSSGLIKNNIRLQNIFNYVELHFQEEIDIKKMAAMANLSVSSFCTYFKKIMNTTFTDFLNRYRIQKACLMLQQEKTISETCFECGFNNVPYFNKVFKTITNKTPSAFKKEKLTIHFFPAKKGEFVLVDS